MPKFMPTLFTALMGDNMAIGARVYNDAALTIGNDSASVLTFNSELFDTGNIHSTSVNTSRLTVPSTGIYIIWGNVRWVTNANGIRIMSIRLNGSTVIGQTQVSGDGTASFNMTHTVSAIYNLTANDYVELQVYQNSGGNLNVSSANFVSPEFAVAKLAD